MLAEVLWQTSGVITQKYHLKHLYVDPSNNIFKKLSASILILFNLTRIKIREDTEETNIYCFNRIRRCLNLNISSFIGLKSMITRATSLETRREQTSCGPTF